MDLERRLERAARTAWPAEEERVEDGWLLRFNHDVTNRGNSVLAVDRPAAQLAERIEAAERFYRERGLRACFQVTPHAEPDGLDAALEARGYTRTGRRRSGCGRMRRRSPDRRMSRSRATRVGGQPGATSPWPRTMGRPCAGRPWIGSRCRPASPLLPGMARRWVQAMLWSRKGASACSACMCWKRRAGRASAGRSWPTCSPGGGRGCKRRLSPGRERQRTGPGPLSPRRVPVPASVLVSEARRRWMSRRPPGPEDARRARARRARAQGWRRRTRGRR